MSLARVLEKAAGDPVRLALGVGIVLAIVYFLGRQAVKDVAGAVGSTVGGAVSGTNVITRGTPFEGRGVLGTLGAATNAASGGLLGQLGEKIGGALFDLFNEDANVESDRRARALLSRRAAARNPVQPQDKPTALLRF